MASCKIRCLIQDENNQNAFLLSELDDISDTSANTNNNGILFLRNLLQTGPTCKFVTSSDRIALTD